MPQSLWIIRRFITLEGALSSPLEQDRTSMGNPCKNMGSSFHNRNSSQEESTSCRWDPMCCSGTARKGTLFPVEITYTHFLCDCRCEQYSSHRITAAVFGGNPLLEPGNLTSQGEDDRSLHQACNFPRCKKNFNSPFICPCQPGMFYLLVKCLL